MPALALVPLPDDISFEASAAISCGTGTAYGGLKRLGLEGDEMIVRTGAGRLFLPS